MDKYLFPAPLGKGQDQGQGQGPGLVDQGKNGRSLTDTADPEEGKMEGQGLYYAFSYFLQFSNCFGKLKNLDFIKCRTSRKVILKNFE